jgi:hypothetical protein
MISLPTVKRCFGLTERQMKVLHFMWSIPRLQSIRLTTVKAAKELVLKKHGSLEAWKRKHQLNPKGFPSYKFDLRNWYRQAPLHQLSYDPYASNEAGIRPHDPYDGMGAVHFPSAVNSRIEQGYWCRECRDACAEYELDELDFDAFSRLVPPNSDPRQYLRRLQDRAWSRADFIQHAKLCHL